MGNDPLYTTYVVMSVRIIKFASGEYYHLYNRGNSKQEIFHDQNDYDYFIDLLSCLNTESRITVRDSRSLGKQSEDIVSLGAYCLMPNHFHILIKQEKDGGISKFMQKISTSYVMYYNKKYKHTGGLFEGKFKSKYAGEDTYLKYLFSYIHLNPLKLLDPEWKVKAKYPSSNMVDFLCGYKYSSFNEYYLDKFDTVNKKAFPDYFPTRGEFLTDISRWFKST